MTKRKQRSQTQWLSLINQQQESGLTASQFCRQHGLNPQYFSKRKRQLGLEAEPVSGSQPFVKLQHPSKQLSMTMGANLVLSYEGIQLQLSAAVEPQWLAQLLRALS